MFAAILCGCNQGSVETIASNTVMSSQIYQVYDVEGKKGETKIVATFRVGGATGTTLALTEPGKILYNGTALEKSDPSKLIGTNHRIKGTDYRSSAQNYTPAHKFEFTDNDGKIYTNSINLLPIEVSANGGLALQSSEQTTIPLSRTVGTDETLTIGIDTIIDDAIATADNSVYFNPARNAIIVTPKYWQSKQLKAKAEITIKVKKSVTIAQGSNLGGSISASFAAAPVYVSVSNSKNAVNANVKTANTTANTNVRTANVSANANVKTANISTNTTAKVVSANTAAKNVSNANVNK